MRTFAFAVALAVVASLGAPLAAAQSQGALTPPHADAGVDTDFDTLYNFLRITVNFDVTTAGFFYVYVDLYDGTDTFYITGGSGAVNAPLGAASVDVDLAGYAIRNSGFDGPYVASIYLFDDVDNLDDIGTWTTTSPYLSTDFDLTPLTFAPPHSDQGIDTNANGLYDILRVTVRVDVSDPGTYDFYGDLFDMFSNWIDFSYATVSLSPGIQTVDLDFTGYAIRANGVDGNFDVTFSAYDGTTGNFLDSGFWTTQSYLATDFEAPPAAFIPPHSDMGVDTDGNMLYDEIAVDLMVDVQTAGDFIIFGDLYDSAYTSWFGSEFAFVSLTPGIQTVRLAWPTVPMVAQGVPGPYAADVQLYLSSGDFLDADTHLTQAYGLAEFDPLPAALNPPHSDQGLDLDVPPDGEYNLLEVDVGVDVVEAGSFFLGANLFDPSGLNLIDSQLAVVTLPTGAQTISVFFSGIAIRNAGFDGQYIVELFLGVPSGFSPVFIDTGMHVTNSYLATDFQSTTAATLSGSVRDLATTTGIPFADVTAFDYLNRNSVGGVADGTGAYSLPLYDGNWVVTFDAGSHNSELVPVTVAGATTLDMDLYPTTPNPIQVDITMNSWNDLSMAITLTLEEDNRTFRQFVDWQLGNRDFVLSQAEWDAFLLFVGFTPQPPAASTDEMFLVDGSAYDYVPGSDIFQFLNAPGPVDSPALLGFLQSASYANPSIPAAASHTIAVNATYDLPWQTYYFTAALPAGYTATSIMASPNVTVSGIGMNFVTVDPGPDPDLFDPVFGEWVYVTAETPDTTPPVLASVFDTPDPVLLASPVAVNASASDDFGLASVFLQVWDPGGALVVDAPMTPTGGTYYEYAYAPATVGVHTYTVTAYDTAGNTALASGSFRAYEATPPTVTGATATPSPQELGQLVAFAATVADNVAVDVVSVEVRDPAGAVLGNFTMAYNVGSGQYEASQAVGAVGTNDFTVWANDTSDNWASASGTFEIVDTTDPSLTGAGGNPDPAEVGTAVTLSVTATDLGGIATITVEIRDPVGAVVGTFAMANAGGGVWEYDHSPSDLGTYTFTVTATDGSGNTATAGGSFVSQDTTDPVADAGTDEEVDAGTAVTLDGSDSTDNHGIVNWTWTFTEGGQTKTLYGETATHTFATAGTYEVTMRVTDESGNWAEDVVQITVGGAPPDGGIGGMPAWVWAAIVLIIVAILAAVLLMMRRRRKPETIPPGGGGGTGRDPPTDAAPAAPPTSPTEPPGPPPPS